MEEVDTAAKAAREPAEGEEEGVPMQAGRPFSAAGAAEGASTNSPTYWEEKKSFLYEKVWTVKDSILSYTKPREKADNYCQRLRDSVIESYFFIAYNCEQKCL